MPRSIGGSNPSNLNGTSGNRTVQIDDLRVAGILSAATENFEAVLQTTTEHMVRLYESMMTGRGRRNLEALNRLMVVRFVAQWEAYIEDLVKEAMGSVRAALAANPPPENLPGVGVYDAFRSKADIAIKIYTPPSQGRLMTSLRSISASS